MFHVKPFLDQKKTLDFAALWRRFGRKNAWFREPNAGFLRAIFEAK